MVTNKVKSAIMCFEAARFDGLYEKLAEEADKETGSLFDLVERRLLYAEGF